MADRFRLYRNDDLVFDSGATVPTGPVPPPLPPAQPQPPQQHIGAGGAVDLASGQAKVHFRAGLTQYHLGYLPAGTRLELATADCYNAVALTFDGPNGFTQGPLVANAGAGTWRVVALLSGAYVVSVDTECPYGTLWIRT